MSLEIKGYVSEPERKIPVIDSADVVILGGGPSGVSAAIAAARNGADVLLLEKQYFLGGLWTGCDVLPMIDMSGLNQKGEWKQCIFGFADEVVARLTGLGMCIVEKGHPRPDPEAAKYVLEQYISECGVRILYNCQGANVLMSGDRIDSIIVECKSGRVAIKAKTFVDCSGDGDIMEWAGEDFEVRKVNIGAMWRYGNAEKLDPAIASPTPVKGVRMLHYGGEAEQDGLDVYNLTRLELKYRKMMFERALEDRKRPGCEDLFLLDSPSLLGVRVTRVLNSVCDIDFASSLKYTNYADCIGISGGDTTINYMGGKMKGCERPVWQIPYSALTPKRVENLLVAGRCFGYDNEMTYDAREVGTCFVTGQAAGTAAALSAISRCSVRDVNITDLQSSLRKQNVKLDY